jgi:hypothetical protein
MDIRAALAAEHSKKQTMRIVEYVGDDVERFRKLMSVFLGNDYRPTQRASWAVNCCVEKHPSLVRPYFKRLIGLLEDREAHNAVRRNVARMLQFVEIPNSLKGRTFDACYDLLNDPAEPVAVRVFALSVAARIAEGQPDLRRELQLAVKSHLPHTSVAFHKRARLVL